MLPFNINFYEMSLANEMLFMMGLYCFFGKSFMLVYIKMTYDERFFLSRAILVRTDTPLDTFLTAFLRLVL